MIKPNKYTDISLSVIGLSADILDIFKKDHLQRYNDVSERIVRRRGEMAKQNLLPAVQFLYMLGKIRYHQEEDIIELIR